jgi:hypothetical protein
MASGSKEKPRKRAPNNRGGRLGDLVMDYSRFDIRQSVHQIGGNILTHSNKQAIKKLTPRLLWPNETNPLQLAIVCETAITVAYTELTMLEVQPRDKCGFFILPQAPEDAGYCVYGSQGRGAASLRIQTS